MPSTDLGNNSGGYQAHDADSSSQKGLLAESSTVMGGSGRHVDASSLISAPEHLREQYAPLINDLIEKGVKVSPEKVIQIRQSSYCVAKPDPNGAWLSTRTKEDSIIFLEEGDAKAGLRHIKDRHLQEFLKEGITEENIPNVIMDFLVKGKIVDYQMGLLFDVPRPVYKHIISGREAYIAISVGDNGYVVGANIWSPKRKRGGSNK